jgi:hypothetical protein
MFNCFKAYLLLPRQVLTQRLELVSRLVPATADSSLPYPYAPDQKHRRASSGAVTLASGSKHVQENAGSLLRQTGALSDDPTPLYKPSQKKSEVGSGKHNSPNPKAVLSLQSLRDTGDSDGDDNELEATDANDNEWEALLRRELSKQMEHERPLKELRLSSLLGGDGSELEMPDLPEGFEDTGLSEVVRGQSEEDDQYADLDIVDT